MKAAVVTGVNTPLDSLGARSERTFDPAARS
jgi:hypothetical protein